MNKDSRWVNSIELDVPFYDCDPMGIVWHGNYLKYFEVARAALLETVNFNYLAMAASGYLWPIIDIRVKYVHSCRLQQRLRITTLGKQYEEDLARLKLAGEERLRSLQSLDLPALRAQSRRDPRRGIAEAEDQHVRQAVASFPKCD